MLCTNNNTKLRFCLIIHFLKWSWPWPQALQIKRQIHGQIQIHRQIQIQDNVKDKYKYKDMTIGAVPGGTGGGSGVAGVV